MKNSNLNRVYDGLEYFELLPVFATNSVVIDPRKELCNYLGQLILFLENDPSKEDIFSYVQRLFLTQGKFDQSMIFWIRSMIKNFMKKHSDIQINGLQLKQMAMEGDDYGNTTYE